MKIYLVENISNAPGRVMAIFVNEQDAKYFSEAMQLQFEIDTMVVERTLNYGQVSLGYVE